MSKTYMCSKCKCPKKGHLCLYPPIKKQKPMERTHDCSLKAVKILKYDNICNIYSEMINKIIKDYTDTENVFINNLCNAKFYIHAYRISEPLSLTIETKYKNGSCKFTDQAKSWTVIENDFLTCRKLETLISSFNGGTTYKLKPCGEIQYKGYMACIEKFGHDDFVILQKNISIPNTTRRILEPLFLENTNSAKNIEKANKQISKEMVFGDDPITTPFPNYDFDCLPDFKFKETPYSNLIANLANMISKWGMKIKYSDVFSEMWVKPLWLKIWLMCCESRCYNTFRIVMHGSSVYNDLFKDPPGFNFSFSKQKSVKSYGLYASLSDDVAHIYSKDIDYPKGTVVIGILATTHGDNKGAYEKYHLNSSNNEINSPNIMNVCVIRDQMRFLPLGLAVPA